MNPLAIAVQGLGFGPAMAAVQGLLVWVAQEVQKFEAQGGDAPRRKARRNLPAWAPEMPTEEDEALLLAGVL